MVLTIAIFYLIYKLKFKQNSNNNSNFLSSGSFNISDSEYSFNEIFGEVSNIDIISKFTSDKNIKNISTPFFIRNGINHI